LEKFHFMLNNQAFSTIKKPPGHYGLSLILGGAETTLVDLCTVYANMARALKEHFLYPKDNNAAIRGPLDPNYLVNQTASEERKMHKVQQFDPATIWLIFEAMLEVYRPNEDASWKYYESAQKIAWKTGTSYGFRDGWAVGITPDYVVGVWVGNADGEGRPGLTGINTAGPILFDVFDQLPNHGWFNKPQSELIKIEICRQSGYKAGKYCPLTDQIDSHKSGNLTANCPYHHLIHLEKSGNFQVSSNCESVQNMISKSWFVLPPIQAHYYRKKSAFYKSLPPFRADCKENFSINNPMQAIYPKNNSKIYIPTELNGKRGSVVLEVAHNDLNAAIYWHLDENYISTTRKIHKLELSPIPGEHQLTLFDQNGASLELNFKIIEKESGI